MLCRDEAMLPPISHIGPVKTEKKPLDAVDRKPRRVAVPVFT